MLLYTDNRWTVSCQAHQSHLGSKSKVGYNGMHNQCEQGKMQNLTALTGL